MNATQINSGMLAMLNISNYGHPLKDPDGCLRLKTTALISADRTFDILTRSSKFKKVSEMKLLEFLIAELKEWPARADFVADNRLSIAAFGMDGYCEALDLPSGKLSDRGGMVTKCEWQAAVDALNADKCEHSHGNKIGCPECGELNAPKVTDIKWPDGAEFVGTGDSEGFDPFYRNITDDSYEVLCSDSLWRKLGGTPAFTPLTPRPAETESDKSAQKVVETEIDWSNQPEGFPLWLEGTTTEYRNHNGWYRDSGQIFEGSNGGQWRSCREGQFFTVHRRPELNVAEWDGVGLPPVGKSVCEYLGAHQFDKWTVVSIFAHYGHTVFVDYGDGWRAETDSSRFRKIRTAEQVAAEERERFIDEMAIEVRITGEFCTIEREIYGRIYSRGYRKQVAK